MSKKLMVAVLALACCFGLTACSKGPAEAAIKAADEALVGVKADASLYVPDQFQAVEASLAAAKESFQKGDYKQALAGAKDIAAQAKDLAAAAAAKKEELGKSWDEMNDGVPGMVGAIQIPRLRDQLIHWHPHPATVGPW